MLSSSSTKSSHVFKTMICEAQACDSNTDTAEHIDKDGPPRMATTMGSSSGTTLTPSLIMTSTLAESSEYVWLAVLTVISSSRVSQVRVTWGPQY